MMFVSVSILLVPGEKHETLTTSDSGWVYDIALEISQKGSLVDRNPLSHAPYGWTVSFNEQLQPLLAVMLYNGVHAVNPSVTLMDVVKFWAPLCFALSLIPIFLIGRELGGDFAGVAAVFFATTMTTTIYWMKVGSFDREPLKLLLTSASIFFTIKLFKAERADFLRYAALAGLSFGLFTLEWPGALFFAAIPIGGIIFVLLVKFFEKLVHKFSDVFGAVKSSVQSHLYLIIGVFVMMVVVTLILSILGRQNPSFWVGFFQTLLGYAGIGGGEGGVSLPSYATEARPAGPIGETLGLFYGNSILTVFIVIMIALSLAKFIWSRKNWEIFVFAWLIVLLAMVYPGKGQARFVREWWPLVPTLAGVGLAVLVRLVRRASSEPSLDWLKGIEDPIAVTALIVVFASPFLLNAYAAAAATVPPPDWEGQTGLDSGFMESFNWLREHTPENSVVAIEWSYGHLLTGVARRPTVADGVEATAEAGKWENVAEVKPPDYIYTVEDSTGTFLNQHFTINGRRTDVQRFPGLSGDEIAFYLETYRDNYGVKIDYYVTHVYQIYTMLDVVLGGGAKRSQSTSVDNSYLVFNFGDENVIFDGGQLKAYLKGEDSNQYFAGVVILYYDQSGGLTNFNYGFEENPQIPRILRVFVPNWTSSPTLEQIVAVQSDPYYNGPPLYARVFGGAAPLPDFMSVVHTSQNGVVKVIKINHTASAVYPADGSLVNEDTPEFRWSTGIGATRYEFLLDESPAFSSPIIQADITLRKYTPTVALTDGTYFWRVGAYKGEKFLGWSETASFVVDTVPPTSPQLYEPRDGVELSSFNIKFSWAKAEAGAKYQVQIYKETDLSALLLDNQLTTENFSYTFQNNGAYLWRVRAIDAAGNQSEWSQGKFTIRVPPQPPTLVSPSKGAIMNNNSPTFSWSGGVADNFRLVVDDDGNFGSPEVFVTLGLVWSYTAPEALPDDNYFWKVVSVVGSQQASTPVWSFAIDATPPGSPVLLVPEHGSILTDVTPTFSWSSARGAERYRLLVDSDQEFRSPEIDNWTGDTTFTPTVSLSPNTYYWKVYAVDQAFNENVSSIGVFVIEGG